MVHAGQSLADGRYLLVRKVAEGGTAIVHLGFDTWTEQWRAVKTLLPEYAKRPALRHRFEREAATMKGLSHENVVAVYDAGVDGDVAFMVMEYAEAGSVIDWIERYGPMPPRMASEITLQLCAGIQAAHQHNIIHRDVKPQNLLVDRYGRCKVTDFGIAQVRQDTRMTMTGTVMGTIGYMAPEQHESAKHADERADVYSIAATYYTLLKGEAATHLFMAEASDFEGIAPSLAEIIRRGAEYRREQRFADVPELAEAVQAALRMLPPDPLDTPPIVSHDTPLLDDITPPSFHTTRSPDADGGGYVPVGSTAVVPMPTRVAQPDGQAAAVSPPEPGHIAQADGSYGSPNEPAYLVQNEPYPSPDELYPPESLYPPDALSEDANQLVLHDQPIDVLMPGSTATPTLPTRDELTSDQNRPTPQPLQRFERKKVDTREYVPWLASVVVVIIGLMVGISVLTQSLEMDQRTKHLDSTEVQLFELFDNEVNTRLDRLIRRLASDPTPGLSDLERYIKTYRSGAEARLPAARRILGVISGQVQPAVCGKAHLRAQCREFLDIQEGMEGVVTSYDKAVAAVVQFSNEHAVAGCMAGRSP